MGKTYQCPACGGTEITWDRGSSKIVCPKDGTPVDSYKIPGLEKSKPTKVQKKITAKKPAESKKPTQKKTEKAKVTAKKPAQKKAVKVKATAKKPRGKKKSS
ncbi:MAG: hypothetical protein JSV85_02805 [Candidatus Bathyarchaeota archaeon]|nr:MAG: hypothetical protein JSV85_02805 [Candidatus Bathyarchaeota archaeon]